MTRNDFAVFILTHGRANNVVTAKSLKKAGYTGPLYFIVDNEDKTIEEYKKKFGEDKVIVFDKLAISKTFDEADNFKDRRAIVYARNASFQIAKDLGYRYFLELDDDYTVFAFRFNNELNFRHRPIKSFDKVIEAILRYYGNIPALTVAMAQGGDFIGGKDGDMGQMVQIKRKAMNTFFCDTEREFQFVGRINEDVNTYVLEGSRGKLFITFNNVSITQNLTQEGKGGMSDIYENSGTYVKSFYTVMMNPSCVRIGVVRDKRTRIHHMIEWNNAVPKIMAETV